jgi:hypothetical protein
VQSWEQLDLTKTVKTVRRRTRPWKSIIALLLAIAAAVIAVQARTKHGWFADQDVTEVVRHVVWTGCAIAFCVFGCVATYGLAGKSRQLLEPRASTSHAAIVRYTLLLVGGFTVLVTTFELFGVPIGQLVLGGALTSVFVGIAAQQALSNVFAGLVLLFARPFLVGDEVRLRAGAIGGQLEGVITDIGITYVRLHTGGSVVSIPNSQVLNAIVGPVPPKGTSDGFSLIPAAPGSQPAPVTPAAQPAPVTPAAQPAPVTPAAQAPQAAPAAQPATADPQAQPAAAGEQPAVDDGKQVAPGGPGQQGPRAPGP